MDPDSLFQIANTMVLPGWLALLASPFIGKWADRIAGLAIPVLLSIAYTGLVFAFWSGAQGGFDSLVNVEKLFQSREIVLAGWIHYLAFDLFVGAWVVRAARAEKIPFLAVVPCLPLTFLFGPAGFLAFQAVRFIRANMPATAHQGEAA
ncbi:MAG TPA: ABA4-like family protein [Rhizobiaceae bacterium]|nr:ABA4-like family protein [Rhizobiaceae bacterium]